MGMDLRQMLLQELESATFTPTPFEETATSQSFNQVLQREAPEGLPVPPQYGAGGLGMLGALAATAQGPGAVTRFGQQVRDSYQKRLQVQQANKQEARTHQDRMDQIRMMRAEAQDAHKKAQKDEEERARKRRMDAGQGLNALGQQEESMRLRRREDQRAETRLGMDQDIHTIRMREDQLAEQDRQEKLAFEEYSVKMGEVATEIWNQVAHVNEPYKEVVGKDELGRPVEKVVVGAVSSDPTSLQGALRAVEAQLAMRFQTLKRQRPGAYYQIVAGLQEEMIDQYESMFMAGDLPDAMSGPVLDIPVEGDLQEKLQIISINDAAMAKEEEFRSTLVDKLGHDLPSDLPWNDIRIALYHGRALDFEGDADSQAAFMLTFKTGSGLSIFPGMTDYESGIAVLEELGWVKSKQINRGGKVVGTTTHVADDSPFRWSGGKWLFDPTRTVGQVDVAAARRNATRLPSAMSEFMAADMAVARAAEAQAVTNNLADFINGIIRKDPYITTVEDIQPRGLTRMERIMSDEAGEEIRNP